MIAKASCAILALINIAVCFSHLKDPVESLRGFGVVGPISPIASQ